MNARRLFVAGATGAVGRTVTRIARERKIPQVSHLRPGRDPTGYEHAAVIDLSDPAALDAALRGCTTVLQLIGTKRARFSLGDTYESSDIATTRQLVEASRRVGVDHFILLSAVGAGQAIGAYLQAKARAEDLVVKSGIPFTIFRPSAYIDEAPRMLSPLAPVTRALRLDALRPIHIASLAEALLKVAQERSPLDTVLEGKSLWQVVDATGR